MITEDMSLKEIVHQLKQEKHPYRICPMDMTAVDKKGDEQIKDGIGSGGLSDLPLKEINRAEPDWNWRSMLDGLRYLEEKLQKEPVFYSVYPKAQADRNGKAVVELAAFLPDNCNEKDQGQKEDRPVRRAKFVLICPGGGYKNVCTAAEGYPSAKALNQMGYAAFILHYRTGKDAAVPNPQEDAAMALKFILDQESLFQIDPDQYAIMGFSSGGHLAASMCTLAAGFPKYGLPRPRFAMLGYPVITMGAYAHTGSRENLLGNDPSRALIEQYSIEKQVDPQFPAVFLWQCEADPKVPIQNSRLLEEALKQQKIPNRYQVYSGSFHGWGLGEETEAQGWLLEAVSFWESLE